MYDKSLLINYHLYLSKFEEHIANNQALATFENITVIVDIDYLELSCAVIFKNCIFILLPNKEIPGVLINTSETFRIEDSLVEVNIYVRGKSRKKNDLSYLDKDGPNIFIDNCEFNLFQYNHRNSQSSFINPTIQISGTIDHCRVICKQEVQLYILQCKFTLFEVTGSCSNFQISESFGRELKMYQFTSSFMWFQKDLSKQFSHVEIDIKTIENLSHSIYNTKHKEYLIQALLMFMNTFKTNKNGALFLECNSILCNVYKYKKPNILLNFLIYGIFKNFYSTSRMILFSLFIIFSFGFLYAFIGYLNNSKYNLLDWQYFSAITFTTVGYGDITPCGISKIIAPIEAFSGILLVMVTGWILSRQYSDF
ncbi:potassium channel family protein [Leptospira vanthielii]|uniref:Ion channel n=1 Tax=Leptospira vanthielii serovar Holland str. Waz Holland = ATCC 700522 TaxID=1218591 RepID=N1WAC8_9LEPT|nr:potassium channel family protein [Leptospira vanthielii]EMY71948.1 ion channel [Leptospira vanthielii serovar Holland str. Waz Holland = ATCC 700522]